MTDEELVAAAYKVLYGTTMNNGSNRSPATPPKAIHTGDIRDGLVASIYRSSSNDYDCTNGGISAKENTVWLIGFGEWENTEACSDLPTMRLIKRDVTGEPFWIAVPLDARRNGAPYMFGGNFVYTSDSRFPAPHPIKVFDRREYTE